MAEDYYNVLGVTRDATKDDIKRAYRKLAHQYHPDKENGNEDKFKQVNEAYQVLSNEQKRQQYDQFGQTFDTTGGGSPFGGFNVNFEEAGNFGDVFETFFGGRAGRTQVRRGSDVAVDVTISFRESATNTKKDIEHRIYQICEHCSGNGAEPGTAIETCETCGGRGTVTKTRQTMLGAFSQASVCETCQGEGKRPSQPCSECSGEGRTLRNRTLAVEIPAGIADGQQIRIAGKGEAAPRGGVAGDLYVTVHVQPDKHLHRDGNNVRSAAAVTFPQAALGTLIQVTTIGGEEELTIPAGTQPGTEFSLRSQGFPDIRTGSRGDHIVTIQVAVPKKLSRQQRKALEEFETAKRGRGLFT